MGSFGKPVRGSDLFSSRKINCTNKKCWRFLGRHNKGWSETALKSSHNQQKGSKCLLFLLGALPSASAACNGPFILFLWKSGSLHCSFCVLLNPLQKGEKNKKRDFGHTHLHTAANAEGLLRLLLKPFYKLLMP